MSNNGKDLYEFGPFRLDPAQRLLSRDDRPILLQPKAFETLLVLVRNSDRVVMKEELLNAVWADTFVQESNLTQNIFVLRKALGDSDAEAKPGAGISSPCLDADTGLRKRCVHCGTGATVAPAPWRRQWYSPFLRACRQANLYRSSPGHLAIAFWRSLCLSALSPPHSWLVTIPWYSPSSPT